MLYCRPSVPIHSECAVLPLTDDGCGFDGLDHLVQCLDVSVLVSKLLLLVVQIATTLRMT